ncbi:MAG: dynamin family protein [Actinomycetota bacterium]|nr:dynamin family protein [Actinomycetota bacterium]
MTSPSTSAGAAGTRAQQALPQAIRQWREQAVGWVRVSDAESAAVLAMRRGLVEVPRVVVVGETNRGKSSLVNALLGMPALSPVDAGLATCTYLQFTHGTSPTAVAHFGGGLADITFPTAELAIWAMMNSEPDHDLPPPRWIEVSVPAPLLQAVTLVDTPGVGGLMTGHADLAAEAAANATALLFVVDASAPFTKGELDFLQRVGHRVDSVHFVVAKTDIFRGWREILQADQQLLARYIPRFTDAPFYPVSSTLATAADGQPNQHIADLVRTQSGIVALRRTLAQDIAARASLLADANVIRTTVTVLTGDVVGLENRRRALTSGAAQSNALKARREELLGRRQGGGRSWQVMLRAEIQRARVELTHDTAREVREAAQLFRGAIDAADADALKLLPFHIDAYAQAMTARAHGRLLGSMSRIVNLVLRELFNPEELAALAAAVATRPYAPLVTRGPDRTKSADETLMSMAGGGIGLSLGSLVRMAAAPLAATAFGVVLLPVSLVLGGTAALIMVRSRRRVQDRQHLKSWLMEVLGEAKAQIDQSVAEQFIDADQQLTLALDDALSKQVAAVESEIRQLDGALKLDATERAGRLRTIDERRATGATLLATGEALLERIRSTRPVGSVHLPGSAAGAMTGRRTIALPPGLPPLEPVAPKRGHFPQPLPDNDVPNLITGVPRRPERGTPLIPPPGALGALLDRATEPVAASTISSADVPHPDAANPPVPPQDVRQPDVGRADGRG